MSDNTKIDIRLGSAELTKDHDIYNKRGDYVGSCMRVIERDETGKITRDELLPPVVTISYSYDEKKWWEFWK